MDCQELFMEKDRFVSSVQIVYTNTAKKLFVNNKYIQSSSKLVQGEGGRAQHISTLFHAHNF